MPSTSLLRSIVTRYTIWTCPQCRLHQTTNAEIGFPLPAIRRFRHVSRIGARSSSSRSASRSANTPGTNVPDSPARTRFAPSPTGYLHIGGLRTALFSYLLAKRTGGQFILRIEDTDQKRLVPDAEERLCSELRWAGLDWDEGPQTGGPHGPYRQSERTHIYREHARRLLDEGSAYRCFCTRKTAQHGSTKYVTSGCYQSCSSIPADEARSRADDDGKLYTVRLRQSPEMQKRIYPDLVYGSVKRLKRSPAASQIASEDDYAMIDSADTILVKSDGTPTYHFANVVDDHLMKITHVLRGSEWMASLPLHCDIYSAFGWTPPQFAHLGLLVDENKAKLSKRNQDLALDVRSMREELGALPESLCNFLVLLGRGNPQKSDVMTLGEMMQTFDLRFTRGNAMVVMGKLDYLQKKHVARRCALALEQRTLLPIQEIVKQITAEVLKQYPEPFIPVAVSLDSTESRRKASLAAYCANILLADSQSYENAARYVYRNRYFFRYDPSALPEEPGSYNDAETLEAEDLQEFLQRLFERLAGSAPSLADTLKDASGSSAMAKIEANIHFHLSGELWRTAMRLDGIYPLDKPAEQVPEKLEYVHAIDDPIPQAATPRDIASKLCGEQAPEEIVLGLLRRYKILSDAVSKYLREKLSYGQPGPRNSAVIALLGYKECCRRLGIELEEDAGLAFNLIDSGSSVLFDIVPLDFWEDLVH